MAAEIDPEGAARDLYRAVDAPVDLGMAGRFGFKVGFLGRPDDELHPRLRGQRAALTYRQMADNDPTINAFLFAVDGLLRRIPWRPKAAKTRPTSTATTISAASKAAVEQAEYLKTVIDDMTTSWRSVKSAILRMLVFGYTPIEIVYKIRGGLAETDSKYRSIHDDGKIGWRQLAPRAQETVTGWGYDADGGVRSLRQEVDGVVYTIPIEKLLLFRVRNANASPEGVSLLRGVYRSWFFKTKLEEIEAVGAERDLVGYPVMQVPRQLLSDAANADDKALATKLWKLVIQTRRNHREGALIPAEFEPNGDHSGFKFDLLKSGGTRAFDVDVPIKRHRTDMATAFLCGFLFLGQDTQGGSRALGGPLIRFFLNSIEYIEDEAEDVVNKYGVPRLMQMNGVDPEIWPVFEHGNIERVDVKTAAETLALIKDVVGESAVVEAANAIAADMDLGDPEAVIIDMAPDDRPRGGTSPKRVKDGGTPPKKDLEEGGDPS